MARLAVAFTVAPVAAATMCALSVALLQVAESMGVSGATMSLYPETPSLYFWWSLLFAAVATLLVGLPLALGRLRHGEQRVGSYVVIGVIAGIAPFALLGVVLAALVLSDSSFGGFGGVRDRWLTLVSLSLIGVLSGVAAAAVFWVVGVRKGAAQRAAG